MAWTDERIDQLKKLWDDGLSASQIAKELGEGVTRNAVIGKAHRLGLKSRPSPVKTDKEKKKAAPKKVAKKSDKQLVTLLDLTDACANGRLATRVMLISISVARRPSPACHIAQATARKPIRRSRRGATVARNRNSRSFNRQSLIRFGRPAAITNLSDF